MTLLVAVGCSWGGLAALSRVLDHVPEDLDATIVVAQHRPHAPSNLATVLAAHTPWPVCEADDKEAISTRRVYLAPPGYHLMVEADRFELSTEGPVRYSRPSVDVLFESVAAAYTDRAVAVVLTGSNDDGADGADKVARRGGLVVVQDPETAERREMPDAVLSRGIPATVARLEEIGPLLARVRSSL